MNCNQLEPVGSRAPSFSTDALTLQMRRTQSTNLAITCQAQAYPVPIFR